MSPTSAIIFTLILTVLLVIFIYLAVQFFAHVLTAFPAWWARNIIADDPNPDLSNLDRMDGMQ